jgi:hypothetical protein
MTTEIQIDGTCFLINGRPTYEGVTCRGQPVEGLLFNVRAVQATFDDANPATRHHWVYPDTGEWDPERNVSEFCEALPSWRDHGVLAFTVNFQGGGPLFAPEIYDHFDNNGFTPAGDLKPAYADRIARVLACADALGMVMIAGLFYGAHLRKMEGEDAMWRAAQAALEFLQGTGYRNVLIEVANEVEVVLRHTGLEIFHPERTHETVRQLRQMYPNFLYSTSQGGVDVESGRGIPPASLIEVVDYVLLHGNNALAPQLEAAIHAVQANPTYQRQPKPIVINEDSPGIPNLEVCWRNGASWGYFDQGYGGPAAWGGDAYVDYRSRPREDCYEELSGFQTPPVNWTINTDFKRAFFERVAEITSAPAFASKRT